MPFPIYGQPPSAPPVLPPIVDEAILYPNLSLVIDPNEYRGTYADGAIMTGGAADSSGLGNNYGASVGTEPTFDAASPFFDGQASMVFDDNELLTGPILSAIITGPEYTLFAVVYVEAINTNAGALYNNDAVMSDGGGYWGMHLRTASGGQVYAYNFAGGEQAAFLAVPTLTPIVVMTRHEGGVIYTSINGGSETSTASGDTQSLVNTTFIGNGGLAKLDGEVAALVCFKGNLGGAPQRASFVAYLQARFGIP